MRRQPSYSIDPHKMVKYLLLWISYFFFLTSAIYPQNTEWTVQDVPFSSGDLFSIHFIDENTGWVTGRDFDTDEYVLLNTTDSGTHWNSQVIGFPVAKIIFIDINTGYAIGDGDNFDIKRTTDGGGVWNSTDYPALSRVSVGDIYFRTENDGWIVGKYDNGLDQVGLLLHTIDGETWSFPNYPSEIGSINSICFADAQHGWAVGTTGNPAQPLVLSTSDGGANWMKQTLPSLQGTLYHVFFSDSNNGWACGGSGFGINDKVIVLRTTDRGMQWARLNPQFGTNANCIYFTSPAEGYLNVNERGASHWNMNFYKTTDSGDTWEHALNPVPGLYSAEVVFVTGSLIAKTVGSKSPDKPFIGSAKIKTSHTKVTMNQGRLEINIVDSTNCKVGYSIDGYVTINDQKSVDQNGNHVKTVDVTSLTITDSESTGPNNNTIDVSDVNGIDFPNIPRSEISSVTHITIHCGAGNEKVICSHLGTTVNGGAGDDHLIGGNAPDALNGDDGDDRLDGGEGNDALNGMNGDDTLNGEEGNDLMDGGAGNDLLNGGVGDDKMYGGSGDDEMYGWTGNDKMYGDDGNDHMYGEDGNDYMNGANGNDYQEGGNGMDEMHGGSGMDTQIGGDGDDWMSGDEGNDYQKGGAGNDRQLGGPGNDIQYGDDGNDDQKGDDGNDTQYGGSGDDIQSGGAGDDIQLGGDGDDVSYQKPGSFDIVNDSTGVDTLTFSLADMAISIDLDLLYTEQWVNADHDSIRIEGTLENCIGSQFDDVIHIDPLDVPRHVDGGSCINGDTLYFETMGENVVDDGNSLTIPDYAPVYYINFDTIIYENFITSKTSPGFDRVPEHFSLFQNFPNPFNPVTVIQYELPRDCHVILKIYDMLGREVVKLINTDQKAGYYNVKWDASTYSSGIYFYHIKVENKDNKSFEKIMKMILLK